MGYAVVIEVGHSLLSIGLQDVTLFYAMLVPRLLSLAVWGLGLAVLKEHAGNLDFKTVQGMARQYPTASAAVLLSLFSLSGLPLLAGFPVVLALWSRLVSYSVPLAAWCFLGSIGLIAAGFRSLAVLVMGPDVLPWKKSETFSQRIYLWVGIVGLFVIGIVPQWVYPWFDGLAGGIWFLNP
jgi:NADH:ubiquinone oxidoreductase subunit 2 (subunit N)